MSPSYRFRARKIDEIVHPIGLFGAGLHVATTHCPTCVTRCEKTAQLSPRLLALPDRLRARPLLLKELVTPDHLGAGVARIFEFVQVLMAWQERRGAPSPVASTRTLFRGFRKSRTVLEHPFRSYPSTFVLPQQQQFAFENVTSVQQPLLTLKLYNAQGLLLNLEAMRGHALPAVTRGRAQRNRIQAQCNFGNLNRCCSRRMPTFKIITHSKWRRRSPIIL